MNLEVLPLALVSLLGNSISLGSTSTGASVGHVILYVLIGVLVVAAIKNYVQREKIEPPRWRGVAECLAKAGFHDRAVADLGDALRSHHHADGWREPRTQRRISLRRPAVRRGYRPDGRTPHACIPAVSQGAQRLTPKVRDWMNVNRWLVNIFAYVASSCSSSFEHQPLYSINVLGRTGHLRGSVNKNIQE
jgi:hypothetical protein